MNLNAPETEVPIACTLAPPDAVHQLLEWQDMQSRSTLITGIKGGVRVTFPASLRDQVQDLVRRESACCTFLNLVMGTDDKRHETFAVEITSTDPDALSLIAALAGVKPKTESKTDVEVECR